MMGAERRSLVMSVEEKKNTAFHEAGHALIAALLPEADPLHKVTIIPRGRALGLTQQLPEGDRYTNTRTYLEATLRVFMGGRLAEELIFGADQMTTGAGNDLERATEIARKMVCEWGMSRLGALTFGQHEEAIFLGKEFNRHKDYSEATAVKIDEEIQNFMKAAYDEARGLLEENREALDAIAAGLLEREILDGDEIYDIITEKSGIDVRALRGIKVDPPSEESEESEEGSLEQT